MVAETERDCGGAAAAFRPKTGSVFPAKRKLVKTMMFESIVQNFFDCFLKKNGEEEEHEEKKRKKNHVFPFP
ncbi:hypothetical protein ACS0TY_036785 [Phlomoides rotata]